MKNIPLRFIRADEDGSGVLDYSEFSALTNRLSTVPIDDMEMLTEYHKLQKSTGCVYARSIESESESESKVFSVYEQADNFNSNRPTTLRKKQFLQCMRRQTLTQTIPHLTQALGRMETKVRFH